MLESIPHSRKHRRPNLEAGYELDYNYTLVNIEKDFYMHKKPLLLMVVRYQDLPTNPSDLASHVAYNGFSNCHTISLPNST